MATNEPLSINVKGLDWDLSLIEHHDYFEVSYGISSRRFMDIEMALKYFQSYMAHALATYGAL